VLLSDLPDVTQRYLPFLRQVKLISPPVIHAVLPLHKPTLLQLVDDRHQAAGLHVQHFSQCSLAYPPGFVSPVDAAVGGCPRFFEGTPSLG